MSWVVAVGGWVFFIETEKPSALFEIGFSSFVWMKERKMLIKITLKSYCSAVHIIPVENNKLTITLRMEVGSLSFEPLGSYKTSTKNSHLG